MKIGLVPTQAVAASGEQAQVVGKPNSFLQRVKDRLDYASARAEKAYSQGYARELTGHGLASETTTFAAAEFLSAFFESSSKGKVPPLFGGLVATRS